MFLLRPRPLPDESLSSWRQRLGFANGFWRFPLPPGRRSLADPDRLPNLQEQCWLSEHCGIDQSELAELSLEARLGPYQTTPVFSPRLRWALPIGDKRLQPQSGPMFCPDCFRTDETPFFRVYWRYAFLTECPVHHTPLLDKCPECQMPVWPTNLKLLTREKPWHSFTSCPICGFNLKKSPPQPPSGVSTNDTLWKMVASNTVAPEFPHIKSLPSFFDGLWSLCQLLLRGSNNSVLTYFPTELGAPPTFEIDVAVIESLDVQLRRQLLVRAFWLMEDWPNRFLTITKRAGISKYIFSPTAAVNPPWLTKTVNEHLALRNRDITLNDVRMAINNLQDKQKPISKRAIRHLLEVSESKAIDSVLSRRNHANVDELMTLLRKFESQLAIVSDSRDQKATLLRDYLIFILSILKQSSIEDICTLSAGEVEQLIAEPFKTEPTKLEMEMVLKGRARSLNVEYGSHTRPKLLNGRPPSCCWFIGREGKIFAGHSLRERIAKLMRKNFSEDLWHSCDVFIHTLGYPDWH